MADCNRTWDIPWLLTVLVCTTWLGSLPARASPTLKLYGCLLTPTYPLSQLYLKLLNPGILPDQNLSKTSRT